MSISTFARAASGSLLRTLWNRDRAAARRRSRRGFSPAIDMLESRVALSINTPLSIGVPGVPNVTVGSFTDAPTGIASLGDFVTVSIEGTRGTVIFNGGTGIIDGNDIQTIEIVDASPDFQLTFNAAIQTANPVPYASDGVVQLGAITTANVIRGINTVRGPLRNVAVTTSPPIGFNQTTAGPTLTVEGDQTSTWTVSSFIAATPLAPSSPVGSTAFGTVTTVSFDSNTNLTTITFDGTTPTGTTAGALTLASTIQPSFVLTSFVGVNFSNLNLKDGGGLFVDKVVGVDTVINGTTIPNLGILLSQGLLAYSTIGIRDQLDAVVLLGTSAGASVDGRMFVETATEDSLIYVGPQTTPTSKNSKFQLTGGQAAFGAGVLFAQPFDGVVNLGGAATGSWIFARGVGPNAVLNADSWVGQTVFPDPVFGQPGIFVNGNFAGSVNATSGEDPSNGDITLAVTENLAATARVNAGDFVSLSVLGSVLKGATVAGGGDSFIAIGKNYAGSMTAGGDLSGSIGGNVSGGSIVASDNLSLAIGGSIVNSALSADEDMSLDVAGSIRNSRLFSRSNTSIDVTGNVVNSSVTVGYDGDLSLGVGGNMSGSNAQTGSGNLTVNVTGNLTSSTFTSTSDDVTVDVGGDFLKNKIVTGDNVELTVGRDALDNTVIADDDVTLDIGRNWRGVAQSASSDLLLDVGGSVLKGSSFSSGEDTLVDVAGNFDGSTTSRDLRFFVDGNVSKASRIIAQRVTDWTGSGPNFGIGGRFDGLVNVVNFDASPNFETVTLIGGGAGKSARFYVDQFETDNLVFNGNFDGNLRVLQDLRANLNFNGNVNRITIGGRVGSYDSGNTIVPVTANIVVTGRLLYLNTNSYFQAVVPGVSGVFWNNSIPSATTGSLITGRYVTVVPNLQTQPAPGPTPPQTYTAPTAPPSSAQDTSSPIGIEVSFSAPSSDGGLPVVYYEYSTNATAGTPSWRRFNNPGQGPGSNIALTVDSAGGTWIPGNTYQVSVRAVNAVGSTAATSQDVTLPNP